MSKRYTRLHTLPKNLYMDGAPILIVAGALLKDSQNGKVLAQLKLQNLCQLQLIACKVSIRAFEPSGAELPGVDSHSYLDLMVPCGGEFGSKSPIYLLDSITRNISVAVIEAVFENGQVWRHPAEEWSPVFQNPQEIIDKFPDTELQKQYALEIGGNCKYVPTVADSVFLCTCGTVNLSKNQICSKCSRDVAGLLSALDLSELIRKKDERLAREETERLEQEQKREEERRKKMKEAQQTAKKERRKKVAILATTILVLAIVAATCVKFFYTTECDNYTFNRVLQTAITLENPSFRLVSGNCKHVELQGQRVGLVFAKIKYTDNHGNEIIVRYVICRKIDGKFSYFNYDESVGSKPLSDILQDGRISGTVSQSDIPELFEENNVNVFMINRWLSNYWADTRQSGRLTF